MAFRAVFIQHAALGLREIGIAARQRQTARFVVGRNDEQRPRMRIDVLHGHAHRPIEIAHLRENSLRVVTVRHVVDHRPLDHEHEAFVPLRSVVRQNLQRLPDGAGKIVAAPLVCIGHVLGCEQPDDLARRDRIGGRKGVDHTVSLRPQPIDERRSVRPACGEIALPAAERHIDAALDQLFGDRFERPPVNLMRIKGSRRGMGQVAGHDQPRRHSPPHGLRHHRLDGRTVGQNAQHTVVGLVARGQRRAGRGGIGHPVVPRIALDERHVLGPHERDGIVVPLGDLQHRHMGQPHTVADHVDQIPHRIALRDAGGLPHRIFRAAALYATSVRRRRQQQHGSREHAQASFPIVHLPNLFQTTKIATING